MIRLEMTAVDKSTFTDAEGHPVTEINRQVLFLQEWQHGDGPDAKAIIALCNGLQREVCHCRHREEHHTSYRCDVAGCDCRGYQSEAAYEQQKLLKEVVDLERKLAEEVALRKHYTASLPEMASQLATHVAKALKPKRRTAKKKAARGSAAKKGRRR